MATEVREAPVGKSPLPEAEASSSLVALMLLRPARFLLSPRSLASLELTVALFLAAIFIVLVGTLAQVDQGIWEVVRDYFRVDFRRLFTADFPFIHPSELFALVRAKLFFPESFFPKETCPWAHSEWLSWLAIPFPKGWVIGTLMMLNLVAAHMVRFKMQAHGARLFIGWGIIAAGAVFTTLVILSGSGSDGLQGAPWLPYQYLWLVCQATLFGLCAVCIYSAAVADPQHPEHRWLLGLGAAVLGLMAFAALRSDPASESTMRILYQVLKATGAGVLLLTGCIAVFKKRAGIVLIHAGVGLMMFYDVLVGTQHVESQMHIVEGETVNYTRDLRDAELSIIRHDADGEDQVTVVDAALLQRAFATGQPLKDPRLPFTISVLDYYQNSTELGPVQPVPEGLPKENPATAGIGRQIRMVPTKKGVGTDSDSPFDLPSAYVKLTSPEGTDLGTWLMCSLFDLSERKQEVAVQGQPYEVGLRFRRLYTDFAVTLKDVQKNDYKGTDRVKDYSSFIIVADPAQGSEFETRVWMNNPLRYAGKTFYQSSYQMLQGGLEMTVLQVVDNVGWMTPYVSCMMVVVGMVFHFGQTLLRFLQRRLRGEPAPAAAAADDILLPRGSPREMPRPARAPTLAELPSRPSSRNRSAVSWAVTGAFLLLAGGYLAGHAIGHAPKPGEFDLVAFGQLPVWYKGRAMPMDSFARNAMLQFSDRQSFKDDTGRSQPAIQWLADLMAEPERARKHRILRIENEDVVHTLGLVRREGLIYSISEVAKASDELMKQANAVAKIRAEGQTLTLYQRKVFELANRVIYYIFLETSLGPAPLPEGKPITPQSDRTALTARVQEYLELIALVRERNQEFVDDYRLGPMPLFVPTHLDADKAQQEMMPQLKTEWETPVIAHLQAAFYHEFPINTPPALEHFEKVTTAYRDGKTQAFNNAVRDYQNFLNSHESAADLPASKVAFEAWYNRFAAFNSCSWLYVVAFVLAVTGWLCFPEIFQRASFWLIAMVFAVHTWALIERIYISGRPPVTNLYSSAVFIGWATVLGGLILEILTPLGLGNVVGAIAGFLTLRIAHALAGDGDTFVVLEAVLDTQVWLATHVVCVTLGYAATYLAGLIGAFAIMLGVFTPALTPKISKEASRMTYGVLCFALFFSFWGTVLGGLWADDSWGRFWGWDPKENGALIIVLWNALVLHARWGKMVEDRGLAILAVLGNIVVSWSWFGVNELGIGLHSYGFTEGRLMFLGLFALSQLVLAGIACLPPEMWWSGRKQLRVES